LISLGAINKNTGYYEYPKISNIFSQPVLNIIHKVIHVFFVIGMLRANTCKKYIKKISEKSGLCLISTYPCDVVDHIEDSGITEAHVEYSSRYFIPIYTYILNNKKYYCTYKNIFIHRSGTVCQLCQQLNQNLIAKQRLLEQLGVSGDHNRDAKSLQLLSRIKALTI
jgi:hypothetical protein